MLNQDERKLLKAAIRMNMIVMAIAFGLLAGGVLWLGTVILLLRGGYNVGLHLSLLSVFLPGYSVTWTGAWIGLAWGMFFGGLSGAILYWSYARTLRERLGSRLLEARDATTELTPPTFLMSGNALGIGLGVLLALQLFLTTNWLVVRGTAPYSHERCASQPVPAGLLRCRSPGASIGAVELFAAAFVLSHVLAAIYNAVARARTR